MAGGSAWDLRCEAPAQGDAWLQPCASRTMRSAGSKAETWIAIDPTDPSVVFAGTKDLDPALSADCVWTGYAVTVDGGRTWAESRPAGAYAERGPGSPYFGWACATDPMFAFDAEGGLHAVMEMYSLGVVTPEVAAGTRIVLASSDDAGRTWPRALDLVVSDGTAMAADFPRIVVNPRSGTIHVSLLDYLRGQPCYVVNVRDGAPSPPVVLPAPLDTFACVGAAASPEGVLVVAATGPQRGLRSPEESIPGSTHHFARSLDDGRTFSAWSAGWTFERVPEGVPGLEHHLGDGFECRYDLTGGPRAGMLYCVYVDHSAGDADVLLRASADDGRTWGEAIAVAATRGRHEFMPNVAVAGDGSVHVAHLASGWEEDPALLHVYHAWTGNDLRPGAPDASAPRVAWTAQRVTGAPSDGARGRHQDGYPWWGDYLGIDAREEHVWIAYPDASATDVPTLAAARVART